MPEARLISTWCLVPYLCISLCEKLVERFRGNDAQASAEERLTGGGDAADAGGGGDAVAGGGEGLDACV